MDRVVTVIKEPILKTYQVEAIVVDGILFTKIYQYDEKKLQHIKHTFDYNYKII
jgi:hypothetical protein